jgi:hypothetical protein
MKQIKIGVVIISFVYLLIALVVIVPKGIRIVAEITTDPGTEVATIWTTRDGLDMDSTLNDEDHNGKVTMYIPSVGIEQVLIVKTVHSRQVATLITDTSVRQIAQNLTFGRPIQIPSLGSPTNETLLLTEVNFSEFSNGAHRLLLGDVFSVTSGFISETSGLNVLYETPITNDNHEAIFALQKESFSRYNGLIAVQSFDHFELAFMPTPSQRKQLVSLVVIFLVMLGFIVNTKLARMPSTK